MSVNKQPTGTVSNQKFVEKLNENRTLYIKQGNALLEGLTLGLCANLYIVVDKDKRVPVEGAKEDSEEPVYIVQEESNCCYRLCFCGGHSLLAKFYHALPPTAGKTQCGCYTGHNYPADVAAGPVMTLERKGCCSKWLGCFMCTPCCQDDVWVHDGEPAGLKPGDTSEDNIGPSVIGRSVVPMDVPCFTPTVNLADPSSLDNPFAIVEGPCFMAGWMGVLCDTIFTISSQRGKAGDLGQIIKKKPVGCVECCKAFCTSVDNYDYIPDANNTAKFSPNQKATMLASVVHLDYMFFEKDLPPVYAEPTNDGKGVIIYCTLCEMYCKGCLIPIQCCVVLHGQDS
eukprot:m.334879 g.334879  ORF g.334879 m.334879 type:complete len:341 (+) comp17458_c0_seq1:99-1121(+)